ncbi:hypothetical protein M422DRAFT_257950 [Sphaerobolus stellatus SS14]|uniref:Unplaced genomic scaffold SPHSTscaffold_78, whole genome shotgun sequence n=1 Tax=Sphaerobolus stellatus (strain SS14) TaxID=990650 RepID=A0A0C9U8H5_SPHS4|nr:hypothetical protein M422DRAFT_257950 [Sphaerobolus stellatus SS14]
MAIPETIRAVVIKEVGVASVDEIPIPKLEDNKVLNQFKAVAQNPTDWKHRDGFATPLPRSWHNPRLQLLRHRRRRRSLRNDIRESSNQVAGFVQGGHFKNRGAFAEYLKTLADLVWFVPEGTLSHEEAATLGCGFWTAVQALFHPTRLGLTEPPAKYNSPDVHDQILAAGSSAHSTPKGKVITILRPKDEAVAYNPNVTIQPTLIYSSLGREFSFEEVFPVSKEDRDHMAAFLTKVLKLVKTGAIKPNRVKLVWMGLREVWRI